jgi:hypothetical protein
MLAISHSSVGLASGFLVDLMRFRESGCGSATNVRRRLCDARERRHAQ